MLGGTDVVRALEKAMADFVGNGTPALYLVTSLIASSTLRWR